MIVLTHLSIYCISCLWKYIRELYTKKHKTLHEVSNTGDNSIFKIINTNDDSQDLTNQNFIIVTQSSTDNKSELSHLNKTEESRDTLIKSGQTTEETYCIHSEENVCLQLKQSLQGKKDTSLNFLQFQDNIALDINSFQTAEDQSNCTNNCIFKNIVCMGDSNKDVINDSNIDANTNNGSAAFVADLEVKSQLRFIPPVYVQRYVRIGDILKDEKWENTINKVVEFGCAEMTFFTMVLKYTKVVEIIEVDIDSNLLETHFDKVNPKPSDFLEKRSKPLTVKLYSGNVAHVNTCLTNADAVIAIELIEHLYPNDLENLPFTIFGFMQPKIVMLTTPNADFNVLFPNFTGSRHYDHKFEWTRIQFEDWANNIVSRYPNYEVSFEGIGEGPEGTQHLGCCSQMAIFIKKTESKVVMHFDHLENEYKLIYEVEFPYYIDGRTEEKKILDAAESYIYSLHYRFYNKDDSAIEGAVPLKEILSKTGCLSLRKLRDILINAKWEVYSSKSGMLMVKFPESENSSDDNLVEDEDLTYCVGSNEIEENWDNLVPTTPSEKYNSDSQIPVSTDNQTSVNFVRDITDVDASCMYRSCSEGSETDIFYTPMPDLKMSKRNGDISSYQSVLNFHDIEDSFIHTDIKQTIPKYHSCPGSQESVLQRGSSCDELQTPSVSKAVDSGYPNSNSQQTMDMDSPEQVDELLTESDSDISPINPLPENMLVFLGDNVENGDVANNNQDGEGNNVVGEMHGAHLEFDVQAEVHPVEAGVVDNLDGSDNELADKHSDLTECSPCSSRKSSNDLRVDEPYMNEASDLDSDKLMKNPPLASSSPSIHRLEPTIASKISSNTRLTLSKSDIRIFLNEPSILEETENITDLPSGETSSCAIIEDLSHIESEDTLHCVVSSLVFQTSSDNSLNRTFCNHIESDNPFPAWLLHILNTHVDQSYISIVEEIKSLIPTQRSDESFTTSSFAIAEDLLHRESEDTLQSVISSLVFETSSENSYSNNSMNNIESDILLPNNANPFPDWLLHILNTHPDDEWGIGDIEDNISEDDYISVDEVLNYDVEGDVGGGGEPSSSNRY